MRCQGSADKAHIFELSRDGSVSGDPRSAGAAQEGRTEGGIPEQL